MSIDKLIDMLNEMRDARLKVMTPEERAEYFRRKRRTKEVLGGDSPPLIIHDGKATVWHPDIDKELGFTPLPLRYRSKRATSV